MFNPELANMLPGGAVILDRKLVGNTWVWLCAMERGYQPYATWLSYIKHPGNATCGHYHGRFVNALKDFHERIREQWSLLEQYS